LLSANARFNVGFESTRSKWIKRHALALEIRR
jgi:hypothetical protein